MKKTDNISLGVLVTSIAIIAFSAGFFLEKEIEFDRKQEQDTLIFKSYRTDSVKLFVVMKDGKLQSFWYSKLKRWKIKPTVFK